MTRLQSVAEDLRWVDDATRIELLLDFAEALPPLPKAYHALRDAGIGMIHECQSPVFIVVEVKQGLVRIHADVPREAPTVRSLVAILVQSFDDESPQAVLSAPSDVLHQLGLSHLLGMQRTRGLYAIYHHIRREVARQSKASLPTEER